MRATRPVHLTLPDIKEREQRYNVMSSTVHFHPEPPCTILQRIAGRQWLGSETSVNLVFVKSAMDELRSIVNGRKGSTARSKG